jgi:hypothetical protein
MTFQRGFLRKSAITKVLELQREQERARSQRPDWWGTRAPSTDSVESREATYERAIRKFWRETEGMK